MTALTYRMPAGIPGAISRAQQATVDPVVFNASKPFTSYGRFGKTVSGAFEPLESGDAAAVITGVLVRPYPTTSSQDGLGTSTPPTSGVGDRLKRGYISAHLSQGAAAKDAQVYVRITADTGKLVGDIEAGADSGACVAVVGCFFTGAADASGNVELAFNI